MRATAKGFYALRAMLTLAVSSSPDNPIAIRRIAEKEDISSEFLQQIFFRLRKSGLISAVRGPGGGFFLRKPVDSIRVIDVLEASGEGLMVGPCREAPGSRLCGGKGDCKACGFWTDLENHIRDFASSRTLADLIPW